MSKEDLYKCLLLMAVFRAGGEIAITPAEFDYIKSTSDTFRIGVTPDDKIIVRILPNKG